MFKGLEGLHGFQPHSLRSTAGIRFLAGVLTHTKYALELSQKVSVAFYRVGGIGKP